MGLAPELGLSSLPLRPGDGLASLLLFFPQSELLHAVDERLAAQIQKLGRVRLIPIEFPQSSEDQLLFDTFDMDACMGKFEREEIESRLLSSKRLRQVAKGDFIRPGHHDNSLDHILQFAHIA